LAGDDLGRLVRRTALGFFDHLLRQSLGVSQALGGVVARGGQLGFHLLVGDSQFGLGLVGGRETVGDFLGTFIQRRCNRRPDDAHREPDQESEDDDLDEEGGIDAHGSYLGCAGPNQQTPRNWLGRSAGIAPWRGSGAAAPGWA